MSPKSRPILIGLLVASLGSASCGRRVSGTVLFPVNETFVQVANEPELEPNDESASPHYLGVLRHGEMMTVSGNSSAADEFDGFAISLAEPSEIEFRLTFDDANGELDTWVYDPAIDDIAIFFETDFSPESGFFYVDTPVLDFHIIVRALFGQAGYTLEIFARPIPYLAASADLPASDWDQDGSNESDLLEAPAPGIRIANDRSSSVKSAGRDSFAERESSRLRYLGLALSDPVESDPVQVGALILFNANGQSVLLPIVSALPELNSLPFE